MLCSSAFFFLVTTVPMTRPRFSGIVVLEPEPDEGGRITVPSGVEKFTEWCKRGAKHKCLAIAARQGGLAVFSPLELQRWEEIEERMPKDSIGPAGLMSDRARLAQALRSHWEVTIQKSGRFRPPQDAKRLGLIPVAPDEPVALLVYSGVLHFWKPEDLRAYLQELVGAWGELSAPYIEDEDEEG